MIYFPDRIEMSSVDGDKAWYVLESEHKRTVDQTRELGTQVEELTSKLCNAENTIRQLLASRDADMAWARSAGITLNAVTDILHRYEDADISRGRAVEMLRELAVAAVEEASRELRALEWIRKNAPTCEAFSGGISWREMNQWTGAVTETVWASYAEAATALGWKDAP